MLKRISGTVLLFVVAPLVLALPTGAAAVPPATKVCSSFAGSIAPVSRCQGALNSLCYRTPSGVAAVGVSADGSCHLPLGPPSQADSCNLTNSLGYINSLDGPVAGFGDSLNKMQLWVSLGKVYGNVAANQRGIDQPFEFVPGAGTTPGYYRLDRHNDTFFNNLRDVVAYAEGRGGILVEVVFFAPWEGSGAANAFDSGPWSKVRNRVCVDGMNKETGAQSCPATSLVAAGFASTSATFQAPASPTSAEGYGRNAQLRVIQWTLDALWCYDNVIYQIANEPEAGNVDRKVVAAWHAALIDKVVAAEAPRVGVTPGLTRRHMISANPFWANTETAAGQPTRFYYLDPPTGYTSLAQLDLINSHYTEHYGSQGDLGALQLIRTFGADAVARGKLLGFNETKISGIAEGARSSLPAGGVESARAEAWEFMLNFGAVYDHWGFDATSTLGGTVRTQMRALKAFVNGLRRDQLKQSGTPGALTQPGWVSVGNYGRHLPTRSSRRFWAALQPVPGAAIKQYVLYLHNSLRRCDDETMTDPGCTLMPLNGFKPVLGSYPETLTLNLAAATYTVEWINPATGVRPTGSIWLPFTLVHTGAGSCTVGGVALTPCTVSTPANYSYDIALKITQQ